MRVSFHPCTNGPVQNSIANLKQHWWPAPSTPGYLNSYYCCWAFIHPSKCSAAELVYSITLYFPGDFFSSSLAASTTIPDSLSYVEQLGSTMSRLTANHLISHPSLQSECLPTSCTHVFISIPQSLQQPYSGLHSGEWTTLSQSVLIVSNLPSSWMMHLLRYISHSLGPPSMPCPWPVPVVGSIGQTI